MSIVVRQWSVIAAVILTRGGLNAAEPADLKTFASEESYVVDGVPIVLGQKPGEGSVKVGTGFQPPGGPVTLTAANGAKFDRERELGTRSGIYRMQSADPANEDASKEAVDSLNSDANIEYAYPVFVNPATRQAHLPQ